MSVDQVKLRVHTSFWWKTAVFAGLFALVFILQLLSGAYRSEFGGYPDEPAHYVTSVMVRDYLLHGKIAEPMEFAKEYYKSYPKVAFGHWPPLLYAVQGIWMLVFSESRASVLLELALTTTLAGFLLFLVAARHFGRIAGICAAALLLCLPVIQTYADEEMAESLLLVTGFCAAIFFYRYLEDKNWRDSFWFGIFCSLAILTKGNGWALAMIPPIAIVLTWDYAMLKRPSFWIPVPLVAIFCVPWQLLTLEMADRGWVGGSKPNIGYTLDAVGEFGFVLLALVGWALAFLACVGLWFCVLRPFLSKKVQPLYAVMAALIAAIWVFHSVVPAGVEARKMINALPAVILFAMAGGFWAASLIPTRFISRRYAPTAVAAIAAVLFASQTFAIPREQHYGFEEASQYIANRADLKHAVILVSSESDGEGMFISELMMRDQRPGHTILRASKVLSHSDWNGNVSEEFCQNPGDVMAIVKRENVRAVVVDRFPPHVNFRHNGFVLQAIHDNPQAWRLAASFSAGKVQIYESR